MQILNMHAAPNSGKIVAFFDVETEDGFVIKGFKLVEGSKGTFVAVPSEQDKRDKAKYWDRVTVPGDLKDDLLKVAQIEYQSLTGTGSSKAGTKAVTPADEDPF